MTAIVLLAVMVDRSALTLRNLALAVFGVMLLAPEAVGHPSFQMSRAVGQRQNDRVPAAARCGPQRIAARDAAHDDRFAVANYHSQADGDGDRRAAGVVRGRAAGALRIGEKLEKPVILVEEFQLYY